MTEDPTTRNIPTSDSTAGTDMVERAATAGAGGELHQPPDAAGPRMTTSQGVPVSDNQNSLRAGMRGPALLEDFALREKIFHFDHERIPERVVHARGYGAHGFFECYESLSDITRAEPFQKAGQRTPTFTRFSTVAGVSPNKMAVSCTDFPSPIHSNTSRWRVVRRRRTP